VEGPWIGADAEALITSRGIMNASSLMPVNASTSKAHLHCCCRAGRRVCSSGGAVDVFGEDGAALLQQPAGHSTAAAAVMGLCASCKMRLTACCIGECGRAFRIGIDFAKRGRNLLFDFAKRTVLRI